MPDITATARAFTEARRGGRLLAGYPGTPPGDMATAYRIQDAAIESWPDTIGGWKVGRIPPPLEAQYGSDRLAGPIFRSNIREVADGAQATLSAYAGGFAAIEAEFVAVIARDAPAGQERWSLEQAAEMIADLRIGLELASSPLASINELGPAVTAADFGNNAGLVVGPAIAGWRERPLESLACEAFVDGVSVGKGGAFNLTGGPVRSVQFILELTAARGRPLRAGQLIATGQTTGIHAIEPGQSARVEFGEDGAVALVTTPFQED